MPKILRRRPTCPVLTGTFLASIACTGGNPTEPVNAPLDPDAGVGASEAEPTDGGPAAREPGDGETGDALIFASDGGLPKIAEAGETVVYDLAHYGRRGSGTALEVANETLVFPFSSTPGTR